LKKALMSMAVFAKAFPKNLFGLAVGVGIALTAPIFLVAAASLFRPLVKTAIKAGFSVRDATVGLYGAWPRRSNSTFLAKPESLGRR
jgi:hypothetical protein